jgi:hypothetical protein
MTIYSRDYSTSIDDVRLKTTNKHKPKCIVKGSQYTLELENVELCLAF